MKKLVVILTVLVTVAASAQSNYQSGMQKAFQFWGQGKSSEATNMFERISKAEKDNWLPSYYAAQVLITSSFGEKDETVLSGNLKKAQAFLDISNSISKKNPEIMVQQALLYTAWVAFDGATYGRKYSQKVSKIYKKAYEIAPENPRVVFGKAEWDMGSARFFGKDTAPFCKDIAKSIELFAKFEPKTPFHPNWGKDRAEEQLAACK